MKTLNILHKLNRGKRACALFALYATTAMVVSGQTFTTLHTFTGADGNGSLSRLVQAADGDLYGTTEYGGVDNCTEGCGTVFKITPSGSLTTLYRFCENPTCADGTGGYYPQAGLVQAADGDFYGTTPFGGPNDGGTVFKITPSGTLTTLYYFCPVYGACPDGVGPSGLVQAADGNFYGTTSSGGAYSDGGGTVFKITPSGTLTTIYSFCSPYDPCPLGVLPNELVQATDGDFYGTTYWGGATVGGIGNGSGTLFKITPNGMLTTLHTFCSQAPCADGESPYARLVQAANGAFDGDLYGTTAGGGVDDAGTVFKITLGGTLTTLVNNGQFCGTCAAGMDPLGELVQGSDGDFYGVTSTGGVAVYCGAIFKVTPSGALTTLEDFDPSNGCNPYAGLVQDTNGIFYGTTRYGLGELGDGTVFSLSVGLGPFVKTQPVFGSVGKGVEILGTNLTGATSVTFNGTPAVFTVESSSLITTTVPVGASTGIVQVVTLGGALSSPELFWVR